MVENLQQVINCTRCKNIIHTNGPIDLQTPANRRRLAYEDTMKAYQLIPRTVTLDFNISYVKKNRFFPNV